MKITKQAKREAKQLYHFCLVNGSLDESRVRQVVQCVVATGQRRGLSILQCFLRLLKLESARRKATVESATMLPAEAAIFRC